MNSAPPRRILPPVYFVASMVAMIVLSRFAPVVHWHLPALRGFGVALIVVGLAISVSAAFRFRHHGTPLKPFEQSTALVTDGPFRYSRNPMYLGLVVVQVGVGLALESLTPFFVIPVFVAIITTRFVLPEERMLTERFGDAYTQFQRRVRRWL
jgi:protein-S-isoprenylcysteine O-methyltransferase Ste14